MFYTVGLNHKTTPIDIREKFVFSPSVLPDSLKDLHRNPDVTEVAILSTCNRTEFYALGNEQTDRAIVHWFAEWHHVDSKILQPHLYQYRANDAIRHMMRVAAGLDSLALGEAQILGQMKQAYAIACEVGTAGPRMHRIFPHIFSAAKRVRTQTDIGVSAISIASLAVDWINRIFADFTKLSCLLIGAGETIALAGKYLRDKGVSSITIANRSMAHGSQLAAQLNGTAIPLEEAPAMLAQADIIISATASPRPILGKKRVKTASKQRRHRPMVFIDLAVPRDIEPDVATLPDVFLYHVDDLQQAIRDSLRQRQSAAQTAEILIDEQVRTYFQQQRLWDVGEMISQYRENAQKFHDGLLQKAKTMLTRGSQPEVVLEESLYKMLKQLIHQPTIKLRQLAIASDAERLELLKDILNTTGHDKNFDHS